MLLNCGVGEDSWECLGQQGDGNQPWIFTGRTDVEAETPILWPHDVNNWLPGKDTDAGKDWGQKEKRVAEMRWLESNTDSMDMNLSELQETVMDREPGLL